MTDTDWGYLISSLIAIFALTYATAYWSTTTKKLREENQKLANDLVAQERRHTANLSLMWNEYWSEQIKNRYEISGSELRVRDTSPPMSKTRGFEV